MFQEPQNPHFLPSIAQRSPQIYSYPATSIPVSRSNLNLVKPSESFVRYMGSKERLLHFIEAAFHSHVKKSGNRVGDLFCGTGAVSRLFKRLDNHVLANDNLRFCYTLAQGILMINREPQFFRLLKSDRGIGRIKGNLFPTKYDEILAHLNNLPGTPGYIYREYSPGGTDGAVFSRQYFTDFNAKKIDSIRQEIAAWQSDQLISPAETSLLISDLIRAANRVANIAGTYGCFIKHWDKRAQKELLLVKSNITPSKKKHEVVCTDANKLVRNKSFDVLYLDPPYTWRHYGAYYHILETIAEGDEPNVTGKTGLRPWKENKSRYCDRSDAVHALQDLVSSAEFRHLFLSYNNEGLIAHEQVLETLSMRGSPIFYETSYRRYRSSDGPVQGEALRERLYYVRSS